MNPYVARIVGNNVEIEPSKPREVGLTVSVRDLCHHSGIKYRGQEARVLGDAVEIDPPTNGTCGASIPISSIRSFYKR